jgi:hypothetical protein
MHQFLVVVEMSPDVIGLSVGIGISLAIAIGSCAFAYVYRVKQPCPYCLSRMESSVLAAHLTTCPKHLEFWKRRGSENSSFVYLRPQSPPKDTM